MPLAAREVLTALGPEHADRIGRHVARLADYARTHERPRRLAALPSLRPRARGPGRRPPLLPRVRLELLGELRSGGPGPACPGRPRPDRPPQARAAPGHVGSARRLPGGG